jgi:tetratricopeptide (TPR) repeat protein
LNEIGVLHFRKEEWTEAKELFEGTFLAIKVTGLFVTLLRIRIYSYLLYNYFLKGALTRCSDLSPRLLVAWEPIYVNLGHALLKLGLYSEAIGHFQKALQLAPRVASTHSVLGFTLHKCSRFDEAIVHYHRALGLAPNDHLTTEMMSVTLKRALAWQGGASPLAGLDRKYLAAKASKENAAQAMSEGMGAGGDNDLFGAINVSGLGGDDDLSVQSLSMEQSDDGSDMEDSD